MEVIVMADNIGRFEADTVGAAPKGWTGTCTVRGDPKWTIEHDQTAPTKLKILKQSGRATYPLLLKDDTDIKEASSRQSSRPLPVPKIARRASFGEPRMPTIITWSVPTRSKTTSCSTRPSTVPAARL